ncbi:T9SS type A sorting domain-containing protein [bacterium]|nr:T9SS type A sorting domain-containing protein [bacterium]
MKIASLLVGLLLLLLFTSVSVVQAMPFGLDGRHGFDESFHPLETDTIPDIALDAEAYRFQMAFDFDNGTFDGETAITLRNRGESALQELALNAAVITLEIESITDIDGNTVDYTHDDDTLVLTTTLSTSDTATYIIAYAGTAGTVNGPFGAMGLWMSADRAFTFSFPDGAHAWSPVIDNPACKATSTWELGVPPDLDAVAPGTLTETWNENGLLWHRWEHPHPACTSEMGFNIADYETIELQTDPYPITGYVYPNDVNAATFDFARVPVFMELLQDSLGLEYPFESLKIVECGVFNGNGGQEHQTMISLGHNMITGNRTYEDILMHEISHQWFADYVTPVHWEHFWLNEGFAVWTEAFWNGYLHGFDRYLTYIRGDRNQYLNWQNGGHHQALVNDDYGVTMNSPLPYERGSTAVHQLFMRYDTDMFIDALAAYLDTQGYGHVSSETLRDQFIETTEDDELTDWFDEWVFRGDVPYIRYAVEETGDDARIHFSQRLDHHFSPSHGLLYDNFLVTYGTPENHATLSWPEAEATWTWEPDFENGIPAGADLFPLLNIPGRWEELDDVQEADLFIRTALAGETVFADNVLNYDEDAVLQVWIANAGLPLEGATWELALDDGGLVEADLTSGEIGDITFQQPLTLMLEIDLHGAGPPLPSYADLELIIENGTESFSFPIRRAVGRSEILVMEDGATGAVDTLTSVLEANDIVWGTPNIPLAQLPNDMFDADAVMLEVNGLESDYFFTPADTALRDWFTDGGSGLVSGVYIHEIFPNADPSWLGGIAGTWDDPVPGPAFFGLEDHEITDGRMVITYEQGTSTCTNCCGGPTLYFSASGNVPSGSGMDAGWRILNYGFPLSALINQAPATMYRDELILRSANFLLYRANSVGEGGDGALPTTFSISAYPNPFNPSLNLAISLPERGYLDVRVYDLLGREVAMVAGERVEAGRHLFAWDGQAYASGVYFVRARWEGAEIVRKVMMVK